MTETGATTGLYVRNLIADTDEEEKMSTKASRAHAALVEKYEHDDDFMVCDEVMVDEDCDGGSWVAIVEWVADEEYEND